MKSEKHLTHETLKMPWTATGARGVERKQLAVGTSSGDYETSLVRLAAGARLPSLPEGWGLEVFVLEGSWNLPEGPLQVDGYSRRPPSHAARDSTTTGCTLFLRSGLSLLRFGGQVDYAIRFALKSLCSNSMGLTFPRVECRRLGL